MNESTHTADLRLAELSARNVALEERLLEVSTLYNVSKALSLSLLTENLLDITGAIFADVFGAMGFLLYLDDGHSRTLRPTALHQRREAGALPPAVGYDHPLIGAVYAGGESRSVAAGELARLWPDAPTGFAEGTVHVAPLKGPEGTVMGVLAVSLGEADDSPYQRREMFENVADNLAVAIENARYLDEARALSTLDHLTGLHNRRYMDDRLDRELNRARRYGRVLSMVILDLDRFKQVNDSHGHDVGDRALVEVARVLRATTRQSDVVVRYGGDEFVLLLPETDAGDAVTAVANVQARLREASAGAGEGGLPTFSAGVATFPGDADGAAGLLKEADRALYRAKGAGGDRIEKAASHPA